MTDHDDHALSLVHDLRTSLESFAGCPICHVLQSKLLRYIEAINYEAVNEPDFRRTFMKQEGFCHRHAWQWQKHAFLLGTASLYHELLEHLPDIEHTHAPAYHPRWNLFRDQPADNDDRPCPLCSWTTLTEHDLIEAFMDGLRDPSIVATYESHVGLCRPHLASVMEAELSHEERAILSNREEKTRRVLRDQLAEIIRKHDYRYSHEQPGDEVGAAERAIAHIVGERDAIF
ncbi:MAG: DUF6062 family protein [Thermomicrobiales bacterium]|nr:DUF6062 family protein [Thermomicrobiales bacterium]